MIIGKFYHWYQEIEFVPIDIKLNGIVVVLVTKTSYCGQKYDKVGIYETHSSVNLFNSMLPCDL